MLARTHFFVMLLKISLLSGTLPVPTFVGDTFELNDMLDEYHAPNMPSSAGNLDSLVFSLMLRFNLPFIPAPYSFSMLLIALSDLLTTLTKDSMLFFCYIAPVYLRMHFYYGIQFFRYCQSYIFRHIHTYIYRASKIFIVLHILHRFLCKMIA